MKSYWNIVSAKSHFSEMLTEARQSPQIIKNRGKDICVVINIDYFEYLNKIEKNLLPKIKLQNFLKQSEKLRKQDIEFKLPKRKSRKIIL